MKLLYIISLSSCVIAGSLPANKLKRQAGTATVSLAAASGTPAHYGSGFIYGFPDNGTSISTAIPDYFLTDIGFNHCRAGGAQATAPNSRGWAYGVAEYVPRFQSTLSNYRTTRKFGGTFQLLVHDLWGADGSLSSGGLWPGDNNDWTQFNAFLTRLISDLKANNMLDGLQIDLWNEPDGRNFWAKSIDQYLQMWGVSYHRFKTELPTTPTIGPSTANSPNLASPNWANFGAFIAANQSIPDIYCWHLLNTAQDLTASIPVFNTWRSTYSLPARPINVNEYAIDREQVPSSTVHYLSGFERYNVYGLRANWGSGNGLHDYLGNLLGKSGTTYYPGWFRDCVNWPVANLPLYGGGLTGQRVATTRSADGLFDVYATINGNVAKILAGTRGNTNVYDITITGLSALGRSGTVPIHTYGFDYNGQYGQVGKPVDLGIVTHPIVDDKVTFWVAPATAQTAYAFEFV